MSYLIAQITNAYGLYYPKWLPRSISKIALACVCLPPSLSSRAIEDFYDYFCNCCDTLTSPDIAIVTAGDFNAASNGFQEKIITTTIVN